MLLILAAMRQRFLVLQNSADIAHVKPADDGFTLPNSSGSLRIAQRTCLPMIFPR
jgi:hypothetical protein